MDKIKFKKNQKVFFLKNGKISFGYISDIFFILSGSFFDSTCTLKYFIDNTFSLLDTQVYSTKKELQTHLLQKLSV